MSARRLTLVVISSIVLVSAVAGYVFWRQSKAPDAPRTAAAERRDVIQDVTFSGKAEPKASSELGFEYSGTVTNLAVAVGDPVSAGQILAGIDSATASLEGQKALADRSAAQDKAKIAWENSQDALANAKAENARKLEEARQAVRDAKKEMDNQLAIWERTVVEDGDQPASSQTVYQTLLTKQTAYKAAQQDLATLLKTVAKSNAAAAAAAQEAGAAYTATTQAGPRTAGLSAVEATAAIATIKLSKTTIRAPFNGVITNIEPAVGEVITTGASVMTIATTADLEIFADVDETDTAKRAADLTVTVNL